MKDTVIEELDSERTRQEDPDQGIASRSDADTASSRVTAQRTEEAEADQGSGDSPSDDGGDPGESDPATVGGATAPSGEPTIDTAEIAELTGFQRDALVVMAGLDQSIGLEIKERLDQYYDEPINHGRLYPNLDELMEAGYISKVPIDDRSNGYELTETGRQLLAERIYWERDRTPADAPEENRTQPSEPKQLSESDHSSTGSPSNRRASEDLDEDSGESPGLLDSIEAEFDE